MEITQQPSTIGEMSLEHFQAFITPIIKHVVYDVTNPRFEAIEQRLDGLERQIDVLRQQLDVLEQRINNIDERLVRLENKFDRYERNNDLIGALVLKHDSRLHDMAVA